MKMCCQLNSPWARIDMTDLEHCAKRVGFAEVRMTRFSLRSAERSRKVLETPNTRSSGRIGEDVKASTLDVLARRLVGTR